MMPGNRVDLVFNAIQPGGDIACQQQIGIAAGTGITFSMRVTSELPSSTRSPTVRLSMPPLAVVGQKL